MTAPIKTFYSRAAALRHLTSLIENAGVSDAASVYDIDSIGTRVLGGYTTGFAMQVDSDAFWDIIEQHRR